MELRIVDAIVSWGNVVDGKEEKIQNKKGSGDYGGRGNLHSLSWHVLMQMKVPREEAACDPIPPLDLPHPLSRLPVTCVRIFKKELPKPPPIYAPNCSVSDHASTPKPNHQMGLCVGKPANVAHVSSTQLMKEAINQRERNQEASKKKIKKASKVSKDESFPITNYLKAFTLSDLKTATKNFRSDSLIGEGGFGRVYKGWIDETTFAPAKPGTGLVVAVKCLKAESHQGHREWLTEVDFMGKLRHKNLVKLIGYCQEYESRLLVYEYMPKGCLENHLFRKGVEPIPWTTRMRIAIDVAHGLSFLHSKEPSIIYRDLKSSNILLSSEFNARLSDFGLARNGPVGDNTHVSTRVVGTSGYAAPEYVATGHLTINNDVYSFGVVLLELLSGRRAIADERAGGVEETLVEWAKPFLNENRGVFRIMDTRLGGRYSKKGAQAVAALALKCLHNDSKLRPTMAEVVASLEEITNAPKIVPGVSSLALSPGSS